MLGIEQAVIRWYLRAAGSKDESAILPAVSSHCLPQRGAGPLSGCVCAVTRTLGLVSFLVAQ